MMKVCVAIAVVLLAGGSGCGGGAGNPPDGGTGGTSGPRLDAAVEVAAPRTLIGVVALSAGKSFTCALLQAGEVYCWGDDDEGQLGDGAAIASSVIGTQMAVRVVGIGRAVSLASGEDQSCVALDDGTVSCWGGTNEEGELGRAAPTPDGAPTAMPVVGLSDVTRVFASNQTSCAQKSDGSFLCWGQFLDNDGTPTPTLSGVAGNVTGLAVTFPGNGYALRDDGSVVCWDTNSLADECGTYAAPAPLATLSGRVTRIGGSIAAACAVMEGGTVQCWGLNTVGMLGDPTRNYGATFGWQPPAPVPGLTGVRDIGAGGTNVCALTSDGSVLCWGNVGLAAFGFSSTTPANKTGFGPGGTAIVAAGVHVCVLLPDTSVQCWGLPSFRGDRAGDGPAGPGGPVLYRP